ncbi:disulfide bond formation protein B [Piscinibacter sakaiensis]|uniref:disulfide bond formation protein B n=1 Tax=Piscinibacter sakaiensis TaxID=1547922 RepID=UPI003AAC787A
MNAAFDEDRAARSRLLLGGSALLCLAAVGAALVSQHQFGMEPCPYCILQRVIFLAVGLVCLIALICTTSAGRRFGAALAFLLALSGIATALYQHFVAAATASCNMTMADRIIGAMGLDSFWPDVFSPRASCADAAVDLLGIPYEFWSLALFVVLAIVALQVIRRPAG